MKQDTSWGEVAEWYGSLLDEKNTYQRELILPNLTSRMNIQKGETILDLACGEGFFSREFYKRGANVIGVDISRELIEIAKKKLEQNKLSTKRKIEFFTSPASRLNFIKDCTVDAITIILALQNIENIKEVLRECERVLKERGSIFIIMTHPAFRIPKASSWGWDKNTIQYRRIDTYLTEQKIPIEMAPGKNSSQYTLTFHRPLQYYFKAMKKNNLCVADLEEWASNKISAQGPRAGAENFSRKEIPLFLYMECKKTV